MCPVLYYTLCEEKESRVSTLTIAQSGDYWFDMMYGDIFIDDIGICLAM